MTASLLSIVVASGLGSLQEAKPVDLSIPGARLRVVIAELAEKSGTELVASPKLADSVVLAVHGKDVPLSVWMKRISEVASARWENTSAGYEIVPDENLIRLAREARRKTALAKLQEQIKAALTPAKPKEGEEDIVMGNLDATMARILSSVDPAAIVDLPDDGRVVFSTIPNRMQRSLRLSPALIQQLVKEHNAQVPETPPHGDADQEESKAEELLRKLGMGPSAPKRIDEAPLKALLVAEMADGFMEGKSITLSLRLYSNRGSVLMTREANLFLGFNPYLPPDAEAKPSKPDANKDQGPKIEWSPVVKEMQSRFGGEMSFFGVGASKPWSNAAIEFFSNPDTQEPLRVFFGDGLVKTAEWKKVNLVACLPDQIVEAFGGVNFPATCNALFQSVWNAPSVTNKISDSWWTIQPKDILEASATRSDRFALAALAKSAFSKGRANLDDLAAFALKSPPPMKTPLAGMFLVAIDPSVMRLVFMPDAWDSLRLYGTLSTQQKAGPSTQVAIAGFTPAQKSIVDTIIFGANPNLSVGPDPAELEALGSFGAMMMLGSGGGQPQTDYRQEPTELLPNGLPSNGFLLAKISDDVALKPVVAPGEMDWMAMLGSLGVEDVAMYKMMADKMGSSPAAGSMPKFDRLTLGKRRQIELEIHVAEGVRTRHRLQDDAFDKDAKPTAFDALPANLKARIATATEALKKMNLPFFDLGNFGVPPVPPPVRW